MTEYKIVPAKRQGLKPLIGMYGKSGGGKTHSALLLARGIVGPEGIIVLIDTESGRGNIFSDLIPSGYSVLALGPPFSPDRYVTALEACSKADIVVIDSLSHEWSGEGGILDMQVAEFERMGSKESCRMMSWIKPKMAHKKMVSQILRMPMAIICCLRGEEKTHSMKDPKTNKNVVVTDEFCSPLFDHRFIFEMLINGEVYSDDNGVGGYLRIEKVTHRDLRSCLPSKGEQIGIKHGEAMAKWCEAPGKAEVKPEPTTTEPPTVDLKSEIWHSLKPIWEKEDGPIAQLKAATKWLRDKAIIKEDETLAKACTSEAVMADIYTQIPIAMEEG